MKEFSYHPMFPLAEDDTPYRKLTDNYVSTGDFEGRRVLKVAVQGLASMVEQAFK
jgi:fumarate hydratase, class I